MKSKTKSIIALIAIFILILAFNFHMPMSYVDDYFYAFFYDHPFHTMLSEEDRRISSLSDVFISFFNHYMNHSGRIIFIFMFLFGWVGKFWFNIFNSIVTVLLILEISWIVDRGRISIPKAGRICWIFFALWSFTTGFSMLFGWMGGSLNYLLTTVMLLGFLIPFIRKHYGIENKFKNPMALFLFGIFAGCTNENTICFIIPFLIVQCILDRRNGSLERWQIAGTIGLMIGYILLMAAPGNYVRLEEKDFVRDMLADLDDSSTSTVEIIPIHFIMFQQSFLWIYLFWNMIRFKKLEVGNLEINRDLNLVRAFSFTWIFSITIMLLSPEFPARSVFPGLVYLITATTILIRLKHEIDGDQLRYLSIKFLHALAILYFVETLIATSIGMQMVDEYNKRVQSIVKSASKDEIVEIDNFVPSDRLNAASGIRIPYFRLYNNENAWTNAAFARYFELKGVRCVSKKVEQ